MVDNMRSKALLFPSATLLTLLVGSLPFLGFTLPGIYTWATIYSTVKAVGRLIWGEESWDLSSLLHNVLSVVAGTLALWNWQESDSACESLMGPSALVITLQAVHCVTDFVMYGDAMLKQPVFIWHHAVVLVVALFLPTCPGCQSTVTAFTIAEFGSGTIAVDAEWRKLGLHSRGLKRLLFFGASRILNLYLLYQIVIVTPTTQYFTLRSRGDDMKTDEEVITLNVPVCMVSSIGGSCLMLIINGITWFRMFGAYKKHKRKTPKDTSLKGKFKTVVDLQLAATFAVCFGVQVADHILEEWAAPIGEIATLWVLSLSVALFLCEPTISVLWSSMVAEAERTESPVGERPKSE